jgi:hypothetical protein
VFHQQIHADHQYHDHYEAKDCAGNVTRKHLVVLNISMFLILSVYIITSLLSYLLAKSLEPGIGAVPTGVFYGMPRPVGVDLAVIAQKLAGADAPSVVLPTAVQADHLSTFYALVEWAAAAVVSAVET